MSAMGFFLGLTTTRESERLSENSPGTSNQTRHGDSLARGFQNILAHHILAIKELGKNMVGKNI
jgi:hypothetical protein